MKTERFILSLIAIIIGLGVAGIAFYLFQMTKTVPETKSARIVLTPTPTPDTSLILSVDQPRDEEVVNKKTITVSGKTVADATVIITSETADEVAIPTRNGDFTTTLTLDDGTNILQITGVFPDGSEKKITRIVTYSTETF